jgi:hypothetical protein
MQRRDFLRWTGATGMITIISGTVTRTFNRKTPSELEENFVHPPDSAKPYAMWFWMNGNVTKKGITLDLEAMKSVGHRWCFQL